MTLTEAAALMKKQQELHDLLFEAVSMIAVGKGVINPHEIAREALDNYYHIGRKKS